MYNSMLTMCMIYTVYALYFVYMFYVLCILYANILYNKQFHWSFGWTFYSRRLLELFLISRLQQIICGLNMFEMYAGRMLQVWWFFSFVFQTRTVVPIFGMLIPIDHSSGRNHQKRTKDKISSNSIFLR